jgi:TP901 family phage tail tape measure protein
VLQLAAAANISNAEASMTVANALKAFNLEGTQATKVADLLTAAATSSGSSVTEMGQAFQMGAAVANQAGVGIEDFTTMLAEMSQAGIKGSDAGTSIKTMLLRLISPTDTAAAAMKDLGVNVYDANGKMKPITEVMATMNQATSKLTDEQRNAALMTIFGTDAIRAASIVIGKGSTAFDDMSKKVTKSGKAAEMSAARMKGFKGAFEGLKSQVETALLAFGEPLLKPLEEVARKIAAVFENPETMAAITSLGEFVGEKLAGAITFVSNALSALQTGGTGGLMTALGITPEAQATITSIFQFLQDNLPVIAGAITGIGAVLAGAAIASAISAIVAAIAAIGLPILALVAAAGVLGAAWAGNWGGIRDTLTAIWTNTLQPALAALWQWLQVNIPIAIQTLAAFWTNTLAPALTALWTFWTTSVFPALQTLWDWLATNIPAAIQTVSDFWTNTLQPALQTVWDFIDKNILPTLSTVWDWLATNIPTAVSTLVAKWLEGWGKIRDFFSNLWNNIVKPIFEEWKKGIDSIFNAIATLVSWINDAIDAMNKLLGKQTTYNRSSTASSSGTNEYQGGGWVPTTQMATVHGGEFVLSRHMLAGLQAIPDNVLRRISPMHSATPGSVTNVYNANRTAQIQMSPQYQNVQSPASVYYDVSAALMAAGM